MRDARDLETRIAQLFADRLQIEVPAADVDLFAEGIVDSLMFVKLLASLDEFEVILGIGARFVAVESSELVASTVGHTA